MGRWKIATNRHTTTNGYSWGWIEGHPDNACWSEDPSSSERGLNDAIRMVERHNAEEGGYLDQLCKVCGRFSHAKDCSEGPPPGPRNPPRPVPPRFG